MLQSIEARSLGQYFTITVFSLTVWLLRVNHGCCRISTTYHPFYEQ